MVAAAFTVDLDKPLVFQVGHLEEQYQDWVHQPIVSKEGPRFFENDVLQFLTRTKWWAVPLIWLPVVCWCLSTSIQMGRTITEVAMMVVFGIFLWTLIEYVLHRFLFHIKTKLLGKHSSLSSSRMPSQASHGWTLTCLPTSCSSYFVLSVLEPDQTVFDSIYHSWLVWWWLVGLCDL